MFLPAEAAAPPPSSPLPAQQNHPITPAMDLILIPPNHPGTPLQ